jgi:hypothetical protein
VHSIAEGPYDFISNDLCNELLLFVLSIRHKSSWDVERTMIELLLHCNLFRKELGVMSQLITESQEEGEVGQIPDG